MYRRALAIDEASLGPDHPDAAIDLNNLTQLLKATSRLSVVSFPLLIDRDVHLSVAIQTSVKAVWTNPFTMALWGLIVAALLVIGSLPLFVGLAVTLPVLGHATWHLYRKAVEPDPNPRPEYQPQSKQGRYAADFPAVLWPWFKEDV